MPNSILRSKCPRERGHGTRPPTGETSPFCRRRVATAVLIVALGAALPALSLATEPQRYFKIEVVDDQTGRGVPLVELSTVNNIRCFTDSNGLVAFAEPGLMGRKVFFYVQSHGYEFPKDGFGFRGKILDVTEGGSVQLKIKRLNIAERLYRITGAGIYRDTVLLGQQAPIREPVLNGQVFGQDSVMATPWEGTIFWFWGDTSRPKYPLGQFRMSGATSLPPGKGGLDPQVGVDLDYFVDQEGFSRPMVPMPVKEPIWIDGLLAAPDNAGRPRLAGHYARMKSLGEMVEHGLVVFDEPSKTFVKHAVFDLKHTWQCPHGQTFPMRDGSIDYLLFARPFALVRVKSQLKCAADQSCYEAFTCLAPGSRYEKPSARVDRHAGGTLVWGWKPNTDPITQQQERELLSAGKIRSEEARYQVVDLDTGKPVQLHAGSINWNDFRRKWIMIAVQVGGSSSYLGEIWYAEADAPTGPWHRAKKIVTHERYTFYNPAHHAFFDQEGGRKIYFEATYANTFSGNPDQTPRYDYNQIMYRLDLADPRLRQR